MTGASVIGPQGRLPDVSSATVSVRRHHPNLYEAPSWILAVTHNPHDKRGVLVSLHWFSSWDIAYRMAAEILEKAQKTK